MHKCTEQAETLGDIDTSFGVSLHPTAIDTTDLRVLSSAMPALYSQNQLAGQSLKH